MARLKRIGIVFNAKLHGLTFGIAGLLCGIMYSFGGFFYELATNSLNPGTALAFFALIGMPPIFAAAGIATGIAEALIYNVLTRWYRGVEMDLTSD